MRKRRTARVLLFDERGDVLLIRFVVPQEGGDWTFWTLPGGEIEPGETESEAAARELEEELGVRVVVRGPIWVEGNHFLHEGEMRDNTDYIFSGRCGRAEPVLAGITVAERRIMREIRWWTTDELRSASETVFPVHLAERAVRVWDEQSAGAEGCPGDGACC